MQFIQAGKEAQKNGFVHMSTYDSQPSLTEFVTSVSSEMGKLSDIFSQAVGHIQKQGTPLASGKTASFQETSALLQEANIKIHHLESEAHTSGNSTALSEKDSTSSVSSATDSISQANKLIKDFGIFSTKSNSSGALQSAQTFGKVASEPQKQDADTAHVALGY